MCTFMKKKRKWNTKCTTGAAMCIHEIQQLLLLDLGPAFSHWVSSQQSKAQHNSKQSLWKNCIKDWIRSLVFLGPSFKTKKEEKLLESGFWNCFRSKAQEGARPYLFNFKLKPWSRWGDFQRFNEQCLDKSGPPNQNRQKRKQWLQMYFQKSSSPASWHFWQIYVEISPDVARDACLGGWGTDYQSRRKTSLRPRATNTSVSNTLTC